MICLARHYGRTEKPIVLDGGTPSLHLHDAAATSLFRQGVAGNSDFLPHQRLDVFLGEVRVIGKAETKTAEENACRKSTENNFLIHSDSLRAVLVGTMSKRYKRLQMYILIIQENICQESKEV